MTKDKEKITPDLSLLSIVLLLLGMGLVTVYSSSCIYALDKYGSSTYFLWRQLTWTVIGLGAAGFFMVYDHRKLKNLVKPLLLV